MLTLGGGLGLWRLAAAPTGAEAVAAEAARARGSSALPAAPDNAVVSKVKLLVIYVSGAVAHPGVYQLPRGARVADALDAAGGVLPDADPARLPNLAGRLTDGKQVKVARRGASVSSAAKVDINSASVDELVMVPGLERQVAEAIVSERDGYGPFNTLSELHTVLGLDAQVVAALRPLLKVVAPGS
ncbi:MAG TPA: ComEA family DNA-binding protein [Candidatus Dormibacteraeota bacterium]|nr:ComEA family DNA-binding protein [Candidatus Dormibacteraeota bacterium]